MVTRVVKKKMKRFKNVKRSHQIVPKQTWIKLEKNKESEVQQAKGTDHIENNDKSMVGEKLY